MDCFIDTISKEAILKNYAKLKKAKIKTIPYGSTITNTLTGEPLGHAEMIFHYNNQTWHYTNWKGSTRVYKNKASDNILEITNKIYSTFFPNWKVEKVVPLDIISFFIEDSEPLPKQFINA